MAGSPNTLDLIGKLIRLATNNPNEQEAMRAALKACKLLVQHHCDISIPNGRAPNSPTPGGVPPRRPNPYEDWMRRAQETQRHYQEEFVRRQREQTQEAKRKEKEADERAQQWADEMKSRAKKPAQSHAFNPQTMRCTNCGVTAADYHRMGGNLPCYG